MERVRSGPCHVLAIPYPGRGHINPMMNLCRKLASTDPGIVVTVVVTEEWLGLIGDEPRPPNMVLATISDVVPSERVRGRDMAAFVEAVFYKMEAPLEQILDRLPHPPDLIISDTLLFWAVEVGNKRKIPVASFWPMSATVFYTSYHLHLLGQRGRDNPFDYSGLENGDGFVDCIPGMSSVRVADLPRLPNEQVQRQSMEFFSRIPKVQYILLSTIYELEHHLIDLLRVQLPFPAYAVGPCIPEAVQQADLEEDYLLWLDQQPTASVLYVSHGSVHSLSRQQLEDAAAGLRDTGVRFLWVGREDSSSVEELCGENGMVVRWCDQLRVLSHRSVAGFWTHCGWNSVKEGFFSGVTFLTSPITMDQFPNSKLIVDDWKIGWRVTDSSRQGIAELVQHFMDSQDERVIDMRGRARQLQEVCRASVENDGSFETSINDFIEKIISGKSHCFY